MVARSGSNWVEGWGVGSGVLARHTCGGDGLVEASGEKTLGDSPARSHYFNHF